MRCGNAAGILQGDPPVAKKGLATMQNEQKSWLGGRTDFPTCLPARDWFQGLCFTKSIYEKACRQAGKPVLQLGGILNRAQKPNASARNNLAARSSNRQQFASKKRANSRENGISFFPAARKVR